MERHLVGLYRRMLAAYPDELRSEYGQDMAQLLEDMLRGRARPKQLAVFGRAVVDLVMTAPRERLAAGRVLPAAAPAEGVLPLTRQSGDPPAARRKVRNPTRRDFLRGSLLVAGSGLASILGGASLAYLWPARGDGFGSLVDVGGEAEVAEAVRASGGTWSVPSARAYIVAYDPADDPEGSYAELTNGAPFMALYQRCVHLGCRVPWCTSSTRFECPCHKSRYNRWGEWKDGPAPRGLDRFNVVLEEGRVIVDTRTIATGPSRAATVLDEPPSGPSCLGVA